MDEVFGLALQKAVPLSAMELSSFAVRMNNIMVSELLPNDYIDFYGYSLLSIFVGDERSREGGKEEKKAKA
ncbi:hypothetical protein SADUNF_Sadunf16G0158600 [Salix dunnii]|uniref:Uncharacterized protein n=1 Tax=Salix dunnii TaxID=1413687 RepID=A0A835J929_9ROSI|nr:hypothetical protein SADUNF_Sadunf16G0158600 [Salix dunnii]